MLGEEYLKSRDGLIEILRYTRALAKRSKTELEDGEEELEKGLLRPFRFVVFGADCGKTSFLQRVVEMELSEFENQEQNVCILRDAGYRVFEKLEDVCEKRYMPRLKGYEFVEVRAVESADEKAAVEHLLEGADFVFWLLPAENPWLAKTWDMVEDAYEFCRHKCAIILHQSDRRSAADIPMLLGHISDLVKQRVNGQIPMLAASSTTGQGIDEIRARVSYTLDRCLDRRRELRGVYQKVFELLTRTESTIDDRSRTLAGDQEYLQSIEAQIDRMRATEVQEVSANMGQMGQLLQGQIKRIMRFTALRTNMISSQIALFGKGDMAMKVEGYMIERVSKDAEAFAANEAEKMRIQCRNKWYEMKPHLEDRLGVKVEEFDEASFDVQEEIFCEGMRKAMQQALLHLKLRRFLDVLVMKRHRVMKKLLTYCLLFLFLAGLTGFTGPEAMGVIPMVLGGIGAAILLVSVYYGHKTAKLMKCSFAESLQDAAPALRKSMRDGYIDRVRAYYQGYAPMFESMRRHISDAREELLPQQKVAGQLFLRLKALEQEI
ncbi:GTPase domain-containing protein [Rubritalea spongiae]|uniref:GTPase domain-containing protein n=1 Tax=Rubritalea spongiae TaxID=430797 RepID=A0ABW5E2V0_9BACT